MPEWPPGVVGSITHCAGLAAAAVGRADEWWALGIDAEPAVALESDVRDVVTTPVERSALAGPLDATLVFCAKEAFYKCWSALDGAVLEFHDVEVTFDGPSFVAIPAGGDPGPGAGRSATGSCSRRPGGRRELAGLRNDQVRARRSTHRALTTMTPPRPASRSDLRRRLVALFAVVVGCARPGPVERRAASAHAELLGVTPADGSVVQDAPAEVVLRFSEPVSLTGGSARVLDRGAAVVSGEPRVDGSTITIPLGGELPDGTYTVTWDVISEDSHPISGATMFSIGGAVRRGWRRRRARGAGRRLGRAGRRRHARRHRLRRRAGRRRRLVVPRRRRPRRRGAAVAAPGPRARRARRGARRGRRGRGDAAADRPPRRRSRRAARQRPARRVAARADRDLDRRHRRRPARARRAGRAGRRRAAGRPSPSAASCVGLAALAGFALEGHTRSQQPVALMVAFDVVHLAAGAVWLGGIAALVVAFRAGREAGVARRGRARFSTMAVVAVAVVVAAGIGMAMIVLPTLGDLFRRATGWRC